MKASTFPVVRGSAVHGKSSQLCTFSSPGAHAGPSTRIKPTCRPMCAVVFLSFRFRLLVDFIGVFRRCPGPSYC